MLAFRARLLSSISLSVFVLLMPGHAWAPPAAPKRPTIAPHLALQEAQEKVRAILAAPNSQGYSSSEIDQSVDAVFDLLRNPNIPAARAGIRPDAKPFLTTGLLEAFFKVFEKAASADPGIQQAFGRAAGVFSKLIANTTIFDDGHLLYITGELSDYLLNPRVLSLVRENLILAVALTPVRDARARTVILGNLIVHHHRLRKRPSLRLEALRTVSAIAAVASGTPEWRREGGDRLARIAIAKLKKAEALASLAEVVSMWLREAGSMRKPVRMSFVHQGLIFFDFAFLEDGNFERLVSGEEQAPGARARGFSAETRAYFGAAPADRIPQLDKMPALIASSARDGARLEGGAYEKFAVTLAVTLRCSKYLHGHK